MALFLELSNRITPVKLLVKTDYLSLIDDFKSKNIIGLETNQWIYKTEDIEALLNIGGEIIEELIKQRSNKRANKNTYNLQQAL